MKARVVLLTACGGLIVATCLLNYWPEPDRFPFLKETDRRLLAEHDIESWNHSGHGWYRVRTYALDSPRQPLNRRLINELNGHNGWTIGAVWPSPGFGWSTKDGSTGFTLSRFAPPSLTLEKVGKVNPNGYLVTYEPKRFSMVDRIKQWWRLHRI
ncbi:hypothetical protein EON82_16835 [bacterium]|nr:MAG: hypothetical protein EON82_16835 [bacterium]